MAFLKNNRESHYTSLGGRTSKKSSFATRQKIGVIKKVKKMADIEIRVIYDLDDLIINVILLR